MLGWFCRTNLLHCQCQNLVNVFIMRYEQLTLRSHKKHELALSKLLKVVKMNTKEFLRDGHDNIYTHRTSFSLFSACLVVNLQYL